MRLAVLAMLAACTTFDPIERGVCGNGLIEPGEDCDSPDPSCVACSVACKTGSDCPNAAYTCGIDGLCHAPSGMFSQPTAPILDLIDQLQVADIDRDGIGDVVGVSSTSIDVHYGDPGALLASSALYATPLQTGTVAFGDVDGDGVPDATMITQDGIVSFTSPYGALSAAVSLFPLVGSDGQTLDVITTFPISDLAIGLVLGGSANAVIDVVQLEANGTANALDLSCVVPVGDIGSGFVDSYTSVEGSDQSIDTEVAVWTHGSGSGPSNREWCVGAIHLGPPPQSGAARAVTFFDLTPTGTPPARRPVFAELDTAVCPSLVTSDGSGAWGDFVGSKVVLADHCGIGSASVALPQPPGDVDGAPLGHIPLAPAIAGYANDLVVLPAGVYAYQAGSGWSAIFKTPVNLTAVASGDLDGDGAIDAAVVGSGGADFDVLYRAVGSGGPAFVVAPVRTSGVVDQLAIADFDGNGAADVAYTERLLDHEQLSVAFGNPGRDIEQIAEGAFPSVVSLAPVNISDSSDPQSVIADLVVLDQLATGTDALTLLHGSPERAMLSYFEPRTTNDPSRQTPMRQVVTGFFGGGDNRFRDVVSLLPGASATGQTAPGAVAYRLDGSVNGLDPGDPIDTVFGEAVNGLGDCTVGSASTGTPCIRDATALAWQTGSAHDVIVAVDHQVPPQAYRIDPWAFAPSGNHSGVYTASVVAAPTAGLGASFTAEAHDAFAFDVDGDGAPELVLAFAPDENAAGTGAGLVESCAMDQTGTPTSCTDLGALVAAAAPDVTNLTCVDAAAGNFTAGGPDVTPAQPALVLLCHDSSGTSLLARVASGAATILATGLPDLRQIVVGDVTGDGIDDIVAIRGDSDNRSITVLVQCSSHDLACQAGAVAP